ncbi:ABC transporter permease [Actinocorallia longicatena]|uniref:Transport permease protein n=1 Tax=Actinocorallia longicatena TaxID=111803 RepID=A0ABP6QFV1_9ACTN
MSAVATAGPRPFAATGKLTRNGLTLAWRSVTQLRHSPEKLIDTLLIPIIFMTLFLYVFGGAVAGDTHSYLQQLLPGLMAQMAMFGTMGLGTRLAEDINKGVFDRFRSLPIGRSAPLIGAVLGETVRFVLSVIVTLGFGLLLGFRFTGTTPLNIAAGVLVTYVFFLAVSWISVLFGMTAPSPDTVQGISFLWVMPLTFGSSVFLADTSTMPGWLQSWVEVNPVTHLSDTLRWAFTGAPLGDHLWWTLVWSAALTVTAFPLALRAYTRRS